VVYKQAVIKLENMVWGFLPIWDSQQKKLLPNARIETAEFKPTFSDAYKNNRCLIPVSAYYEWKKVLDPQSGKVMKRIPYMFRRKDSKVFCLAGLYNIKDKSNQKIFTFTVLTKDAYSEFKEIHDRMPVIVPEDFWQKWLEEELLDSGVRKLLVGAKVDLIAEAVEKF